MDFCLSKVRSCRLAAVLVGLVLVSGCGGSTGPSESEQVVSRVNGLSDAVGDPAMFAQAFVGGAAPAHAEAFQSKAFEVIGEPDVSGDTATVQVRVKGGMIDTSRGDIRPTTKPGQPPTPAETEVTWTLKSDGDDWKIQDAPLQ